MKLFGRYMYTQVGALLINCLLFMLMQGFLATGAELNTGKHYNTINFIPHHQDDPLLSETIKPDTPIEPAAPPPTSQAIDTVMQPVAAQQARALQSSLKGITVAAIPTPKPNVPLSIGTLQPIQAPIASTPINTTPTPVGSGSAPKGNTGQTDRDFLPLVQVPPRYPRIPFRNGVTGYVVVSFTITKEGTIANPTVIESKPKRVFNDAAIEAVSRFKYKPRIVGGRPVAVDGVKKRFTFDIRRR